MQSGMNVCKPVYTYMHELYTNKKKVEIFTSRQMCKSLKIWETMLMKEKTGAHLHICQQGSVGVKYTENL